MKPRLLLTFSSGRSSGTMTDIILEKMSKTHDIQVVFANTGWEHPESLDFAHKCDQRWGGIVVWVEAVVHHGKRKASTHKIVTYETASRNMEPFKEMAKKYGIPNKGYPHCTRELKTNPIESYLRSIGWEKGSYETCIGIRGDEPDRLNRGLDKSNGQIRVYPLADWFLYTKQDVADFWGEQEFDLTIPEHLGNCVGCWQKSKSKLEKAWLDEPEQFEHAIMLERDFGHIGKNKIKGVYVDEPRQLFRGNISAENLIASFKLDDVA